MAKITYRSIFISDVHLGTKNCKAEYLLSFLQSTESEYLYLVGDIFDLWAMKKHVQWSKTQTAILSEIFSKAKSGTKVIYIPGNHDSYFREFTGTTIHHIEIQQEVIHESADGKKFIVSHGDEFDVLVKHNAILRYIGDKAYDWLLWLNQINTKIRRFLKLPYWSISSHLKSQVRNANNYIKKYQQAAIHRAQLEGVDGYICGHIHKSGMLRSNDILYCNTGDWVEHCTALTEDITGSMQVLHWSDHAKVQVIHESAEIIETNIPLLIPALESA